NLISCSKHGGTASIEATVQKNFSDIVKNWEKLGIKHKNNDLFRKHYQDQYGAWPSVVLNGSTYYVQPYYDIKSENSYLFAREDRTTNWHASCIYDTTTNTWYAAKNTKNDTIVIADKSWTIVKAEIDKQVESGKWAPVK
ncbi:MAG: hypothetical protein RRY97_04865, partial [Oscillibacter sp.]